MQINIQNQVEFLNLIQSTIEDPDYIREYLWSGNFFEYIKKVEEGKWLAVHVKFNKRALSDKQDGDIVEVKFIGQVTFDSAMRMAERHNGMIYLKDKTE